MSKRLKDRPVWRKVSLGECVSGKPAYGANAPAVEYDPKLPRYIRITDISDSGTLSDHDRKSLPWECADGNMLEAGDLVIARSGATVGKTYLHRDKKSVAYAGYLIRFRPNRELVEPEFLSAVTRSPVFTRWLAGMRRAGAQPNVNAEEFSSFEFPLPPVPAQQQITKIISAWDETLERLSLQIERKENLLASIRERLTHGVHRLSGRNTPWPMVALSEVTKQLTGRNGDRYGRDLVMGVTKAEGIVPMREHVVAEDISRYLILPPNGFAYNPMRINIGSIAMSDHEHDVIVSPDYVVFACKEDRLHPRLLNHLRRTKAWADFMTIAGNGSVRVRIYYASLAEFEFHLPPLDEQRAIVGVLDDAEREIAALEAERAALARQRDALATELLTGHLRVPMAEAAP